jgi:hypothetical protein
MYGTSLGGIEQLMMLAPNFPQRRSGIVIGEWSFGRRCQNFNLLVIFKKALTNRPHWSTLYIIDWFGL